MIEPLMTLPEKIDAAHTALVVVDMQNDFCAEGGYIHNNIGCDMSAIRQLLSEFNGALCSFRGDGLLATFRSARDAVRCALAIQNRVPAPKGLLPIKFRVGVHIGDTFSVEGQVLGDSVNVAARIESLAEPGRRCNWWQILQLVNCWEKNRVMPRSSRRVSWYSPRR